MKKKMSKQKIIITVSALLLSSMLTLAVFGSAGTVADPLVTVSYLNGEYKEQLISSVVSSIGESFPLTIVSMVNSLEMSKNRSAAF